MIRTNFEQNCLHQIWNQSGDKLIFVYEYDGKYGIIASQLASSSSGLGRRPLTA
jgi:hypothetical protein